MKQKNYFYYILRSIPSFILICSLSTLPITGSKATDVQDYMVIGQTFNNENTTENKSVSEKLIEVEATLEEFIPEGVFDDFVDGTTIIYDLSIFVISKPNTFKDQKFQVQHSQTPSEGSPWRKEGQAFLLRIDERIITNNNTFAGTNAVEIIKELASNH